jgi:hypothetical protein
MKFCKSVSVSVFVMAMSNLTYASPVERVFSCPAVSQIKEMCDAQGGCAYEAIAANGQKWRGENPMGAKGDVAGFSFTQAYIRNDGAREKYVACDYESNVKGADSSSGVRMALFYDVRLNAVPTGNSWKDEQQPSNGLVLSRCPEYSPSSGSSPLACTFKISKIIRP